MLKNCLIDLINAELSILFKLNKSKNEIMGILEEPPENMTGDIALPCFTLAKELKAPPKIIAEKLTESFNSKHENIKAKCVGPYVNFSFNRIYYSLKLINKIESEGSQNINIGNGEKVIIDMSSPNIAKPFSIGHLRSTVIGNALYNLYRKLGFSPVRVNHLGDWGTQFGKQIVAYKKWGNQHLIKKNPISELFNLYVKFHSEAEKDSSLEEEARAWFAKLEQGDPEAIDLWKYFVELSLKDFKRIYKRLGIDFEFYLGESFYNDKMKFVVNDLKEKNLLEYSEGAYVVRLDEYNLPPCIILKSDGSTIYATRDITTAIYRSKIMGADKLLYVVGKEQELHFEQVFKVLEKMNYNWSKNCEHIQFGLMRLEGKKMSTRKGHVISLESVLNESVSKVKETLLSKNKDIENKEKVAEAIGIGAVIFNDLKHYRKSEVNFSLSEALNFEGETGPYIQYTYARIKGISEKVQNVVGKTEASFESIKNNQKESFLAQKDLWELLKILTDFEDKLLKAFYANEPSIVARYLLKLSKYFNKFYQTNRIIVDDPFELRTKLFIANRTGSILKEGLSLLGIKALNKI
ncbi:arginine--tRNA ligase [Bacillus velezensis]|uniref:arginine--tRNA ligase n=1 Tax=Bacillus velezensis TaxID=492670 RepID=UPI0039B0AB81